MKTIRHANAKVNLCLYILNRRRDGYHNLFTVFQEIDWYDVISISVSDTQPKRNLGTTQQPLRVFFECDHELLQDGSENLAVKAVKLMAARFGCGGDVWLGLKKNIPLGAGLGGGSSDAAQVLLALNELWHLHVSMDDLIPIARQLGADVPFFLFGGTMVGEGIGDYLTRIDWEYRKWLVLIYPHFLISTSWAYQNVKLTLTNAPESGNFGSKFPDSLEYYNAFESVVFSKYPILSELKAKMLSFGAEGSLMSGSGSTIFGIFSSDEMATEAAHVLQRQYPTYQVYMAATHPTQLNNNKVVKNGGNHRSTYITS